MSGATISASLPGIAARFSDVENVALLSRLVLTLPAVFIAMFSISLPLTLFVLLSIVLMLNVIRLVSRKSGRFFGAQQRDLGAVNGYIEEMMHGQKVVKIFNHEKVVMAEFDALNDHSDAPR